MNEKIVDFLDESKIWSSKTTNISTTTWMDLCRMDVKLMRRKLLSVVVGRLKFNIFGAIELLDKSICR